VRYVGKTLWPTDLAVLYFHPGKWPAWIPGLSLLALIVVSGLVLRDWRRLPYLTVGWLWFLGTLVPVIGIIQVGVQAMANRFAYVPVIGLFLMLVWGAAELCARWQLRPWVVRAVAGTAVAVCVALSSYHLGHWRNSRVLFEYALKVDPKNFLAHNNLAFVALEQGDWDRALHHGRAALRIRRNFPEAHYQVGLALDAQQKPAEALVHFQEAVRLDPKWALPRFALARVLARRGQVDEAIAEYGAGLRILPTDAEAHSELAVLLGRQRKTADALFHYREALRLRPDSPEVLNNLAWLLATHSRPEFRDGAQAVRLAERACELTNRKRALFIGTLAAAYAEAGRFDDAVRTAELARQLAEAAGEKQTAEANAKLLELYRAGKPVREDG
jgi:tetratricopeptide (TPR) repeat protein